MIADETCVPNVVDPLGGSYYVETLADEIEAAVFTILKQVDEMGGTIKAIEDGYFQRAIANSAHEIAKRKGSGEQVSVGVNKCVDPPERTSIEIHRTDPESEKRQIDRLERMHATRDNAQVARLLTRLAQEAADPVTEPDADDDRAGEGPRHGWRDRPAAEGRVRELRRAAGVLTSFS